MSKFKKKKFQNLGRTWNIDQSFTWMALLSRNYPHQLGIWLAFFHWMQEIAKILILFLVPFLRWLLKIFFNMTWLKDLDLFGCSKLLENLGSSESVDMVETFKKIAFKLNFKKSVDMSRSSDPMGLLLSSLFGLSSLSNLNLSYCNLKEIPNDIVCLFSYVSS